MSQDIFHRSDLIASGGREVNSESAFEIILLLENTTYSGFLGAGAP